MAARVWKDGGRRGIAYVENRETAERVMALRGGSASFGITSQKNGGSAKTPVLPPGAMAVYSDKKGKPFAWQIAFALNDWEKVAALVGVVEPGAAP